MTARDRPRRRPAAASRPPPAANRSAVSWARRSARRALASSRSASGRPVRPARPVPRDPPDRGLGLIPPGRRPQPQLRRDPMAPVPRPRGTVPDLGPGRAARGLDPPGGHRDPPHGLGELTAPTAPSRCHPGLVRDAPVRHRQRSFSTVGRNSGVLVGRRFRSRCRTRISSSQNSAWSRRTANVQQRSDELWWREPVVRR